MRFIKLLNPKKTEIINIPALMLNFYLNRNYTYASSNSKFYLKIRRLLNFIIKVKFKFKNPPKKKFLIYDCENSSSLEKVLPKNSFDILSTRIERINFIYISMNLFLYMIVNFFSSSIKQNYIVGLIKIISPKIVISHIDISTDFYKTAKILSKTSIRFIVVSCSDVTGADCLNDKKFLKNIFVPEFLCFSEYEKNLFNNCEINKFTSVGSLKAALAKDFVVKNKIKIDREKYDICLISEATFVNNDLPDVKDFETAPGILAEYTHRLCREKNLKLVFASKSNKNSGFISEGERYYYNNFLKDYDFKLERPDKEQGTYINVMRSKLIIGQFSTILRESFYFNKKVLRCDLMGASSMCLPTKGMSEIKKFSYEEFKKRVMTILLMSFDEYKNSLEFEANYAMNSNVNTSDYIRKVFKKYD